MPSWFCMNRVTVSAPCASILLLTVTVACGVSDFPVISRVI